MVCTKAIVLLQLLAISYFAWMVLWLYVFHTAGLPSYNIDEQLAKLCNRMLHVSATMVAQVYSYTSDYGWFA